MRIFAVSDVHIDYEENKQWLHQLSRCDFQQDVLLLGGDISDDLSLISECFTQLSKCFAKVFYVPGNHDIWDAQKKYESSIAKFNFLLEFAKEHGVCTQRETIRYDVSKNADSSTENFLNAQHGLSQAELVIDSPAVDTSLASSPTAIEVVPLYSWYDFSFGSPDAMLTRSWMDFYRCHWPQGMDEVQQICDYFLALNEDNLYPSMHETISFSHFLPRIDIMPAHIPQKHRIVYPVLGTEKLDRQIRQLGAAIHVYGHSHVQVDTRRDGLRYLNSAIGYPNEFWLDKKLTLVKSFN